MEFSHVASNTKTVQFISLTMQIGLLSFNL